MPNFHEGPLEFSNAEGFSSSVPFGWCLLERHAVESGEKLTYVGENDDEFVLYDPLPDFQELETLQVDWAILVGTDSPRGLTPDPPMGQLTVKADGRTIGDVNFFRRVDAIAGSQFFLYAGQGTPPTWNADLSDEAWAIAKDTLRNEPERIRDVQRILRQIVDNPDAQEGIKDTAHAADLLLGQVEHYIVDDDPADEPLARASAAGLRALAATILRQTRAYGPLAVTLAREVMRLFGG